MMNKKSEHFHLEKYMKTFNRIKNMFSYALQSHNMVHVSSFFVVDEIA